MQNTINAGGLVVHAASNILARLQLPIENNNENNNNNNNAAFEQFSSNQYQRFQDAFVGLIPWVQKALYFILVGSFLLLTSICSYGALYRSLMPSNHVSEQLYFDYTCGSPTCPTTIDDQLTFETSIPIASVDIFSNHAPWIAHIPEVSLLRTSEDRVLVARQAYFLEVVLHLPESETNRNAGMFGVQVELQTTNTTPLASSVRSAKLPYESKWIGVLRKIILIIPLLMGAVMERRTIVVPSYRHFIESSDAPLRYIIVRLLARGSRRPIGSHIEVVEAEIRIGTERTAFQDLLQEWFYSCTVIGVAFFFLLQALTLTLVQIWLDIQRRKRYLDDARRAERENPHEDLLFEAANFVAPDDDDPWDDIPISVEENMSHGELSNRQTIMEYDSSPEFIPEEGLWQDNNIVELS